MATGIKRKHGVEQIIGALLKAELAEKAARSIRYQLGIAKLPLAKELVDFTFAGTPINEQLVRDLSHGLFLADKRNVIASGDTGEPDADAAAACRLRARATLRSPSPAK